VTDIGEAVAVMIATESEGNCPFCDSKSEPKEEELEIVNDSAKLSKNMGGMSKTTTRNPDADEDYYIFDQYWCDNDESYIGLNAHHIIPGNASLAECPEILKWFAGTVYVTKKFHDKKLEKEVACIPAAKQHATFEKKVLEKYKNEELYGDAEMSVVYSVNEGSKAIFRKKVVSENHVFGKVEYDVNDLRNGIWLPSSNAIAGWAEVKNVKSRNIEGDETSFAEAYAFNTMAATGKQFHDAHPAYSEKIIEKLKGLDVKVGKLAKACHEHDSDSKEGGPYPAPARLDMALHKLSESFSKRLTIAEKKPTKPWVTSTLALAADYKKLSKHTK